eukprot:764589-Hanusia_phi.AAC.1
MIDSSELGNPPVRRRYPLSGASTLNPLNHEEPGGPRSSVTRDTVYNCAGNRTSPYHSPDTCPARPL